MAPDDMMIAVSLVDVSPSIDTQLNVLSATRENVLCSTSAEMSASVKIMAIIVAMSGSIIPTPFATPETTAELPAIIADDVFSTVSVVMIPRAISPS